jgi:putative transposase
MLTPAAKREAVAHACTEHGVSQRRACEVLAVDRSSVRYRSVRSDDASLREAMKMMASERRRFGYRRIHVMLQRQGISMNLKKLRRLYRGLWRRDLIAEADAALIKARTLGPSVSRILPASCSAPGARGGV